jgi:hypothetical protein
MLAICLSFMLGAAIGGFATIHLAENGLSLPIGMLVLALWLSCRDRYSDA